MGVPNNQCLPHSGALGRFFKADYLARATEKRKVRSMCFLIPTGLQKVLQEQIWYLPELGERAKQFRRPVYKAFHALAPTSVSTSLIEPSPPA